MIEHQISELENVVSSKELQVVIDEHKKYLQEEVNKFVRIQEITKAYGSLCKLDDFDNIIRLAKKRLDELKKEKEGSK